MKLSFLGEDFFVSLNLIVYMNYHKDIKISNRSAYECAACVLLFEEVNLMQLDMGSAIFVNVFLSCLFHKSNSHHSELSLGLCQLPGTPVNIKLIVYYCFRSSCRNSITSCSKKRP